MATVEACVNWIAFESEDYDGYGGENGYGWARATTDEVAAGLGIDPEQAYRLLKSAARKKLVLQDMNRRKGVQTKRFGESQVGWAIWEVHLTEAQTHQRDPEKNPNLKQTPNARPKILIVSSNVVSDAELDQHGLSTRRYMRLGSGGMGQRIRPTAIDTIKVETHPEWARSTGERYARLNWCEACAQYTEWAGGECTNCPGGAADGGEPVDYEPNASPHDTSHLNALELRLSHERERLRAARTPREQAFRAQQVASCEREIAGERKFLRERGIDLSVDDDVAALSDDELLAELESNPSSPLEWIKGLGVDRDGHNLTWWKNKTAKWRGSSYERPTVYIQVRAYDRAGQPSRDRNEFGVDQLKEAKAFAKEWTTNNGTAEVEGRVVIPHQGSVTIPIGEWRNSASDGYYVWSVEGQTQMPVTRRGPFADYDEAITVAKQETRGAGSYDSVVSFGGDPEAGDFVIQKAFKAWSGEVHYASDLPRVGGRLRELRR
jgi:hypothetical protein